VRIVVTGSRGFIGANLVQSLCTLGREVVTVSRKPQLHGGVRSHHCLSVTDSGFARILNEGDIVVHLAALGNDGASFADPVRYGESNASGTLNVLEACRRRGARFVFTSTQRVYASSNEPINESSPVGPQSPYGYSKFVAETWTRMYSELYQVPSVILRLFSVYGPGQVIEEGTSGVVSIFAHRTLSGEDMVVHGGQVRDFLYIDDAVAAIELAMDSDASWGSTYNIGSGVGTSLVDLARIIKEKSGSESKIAVDEDYPDQSQYLADISKAQNEIGYSPKVEIADGVSKYLEWLRSR